jgi:4-hydroxymandelate oxidase
MAAAALAQQPPPAPGLRTYTNVFQLEKQAMETLTPRLQAEIAGSDRAPFDRITFRPRLMIDALQLNLSSELFGTPLFTPILIAPLARQERFHRDAELATARGAAASKSVMVIAADPSRPVGEIADNCNGPFWIQASPSKDVESVRAKVAEAAGKGCKAVCLTLGIPGAEWDWPSIDRFRANLPLPVILKGILTPEEARLAATRGIQGIVVSSWRGSTDQGAVHALDALVPIVESVAGKIPILMDGSLRRGTDIMKALALGARAVLIGRPVLWGLSAYGADGVQYAMELLQTELARTMAMCGRRTLKEISRTAIRLHKR